MNPMEEFIADKPKSKKHHYIPIFYLKGFTDDNDQFYVYDKKLDKIWQSSPDNSFFEKHRNTAADKNVITDEIIKTDFPEYLLSVHDAKAAPAIDAIRKSTKDDQDVLTIERLYQIRHFIFSLFWRSPANDEFRNDFIKKNSFRSMGLRYVDKATGMPNLEAEDMMFSSDLFRKMYPWILPLITFENSGDFKNNFSDWKLLYHKDPVHLVTDNPIIHPPIKDFSCLHRNVIFHISSTRTIVSTDKIIPHILPSVFSLRIDLLLFIRAHRFVASANRFYLEWIINHTKKFIDEPGWESSLPDKIFGAFY
ncbi:MAG TPA: DUF4238 domain-containing protein [Chitinophagaceae bacterium]|nr:DUF4238 domain-containing protein [Chitinophagaceae bacterium]